jgi:hypothetical protein
MERVSGDMPETFAADGSKGRLRPFLSQVCSDTLGEANALTAKLFVTRQQPHRHNSETSRKVHSYRQDAHRDYLYRSSRNCFSGQQ